MKKIIIISVLALILMEGISWWVLKSNLNDSSKPSEENQISVPLPNPVNQPAEKQNNTQTSDSRTSVPSEVTSSTAIKNVAGSEGSFPLPSTEVVNGVTERTIHIGVRQWEWDPKTIQAKEGESVRLIVHNADVKHGLAIPELGVNEDIPPDGAVITFKATKKGTFEFFCSVYCGEGHMEMRGKIIIE